VIDNPTKPYSGLTIILDEPSRFDLDSGKLISGFTGQHFDDFLSPLDRRSVQIRTLDEDKDLLPDTKVVLGLGKGCIGTLCSEDYSLNEIRGYPLNYQGLPLICSYAPQVAFDRKDFNIKDNIEDNDQVEGESSLKGHGKTRRRNWRWWLMQDIRRAIRCLHEKLSINNYNNNKFIATSFSDDIDIIDILKNTKNTNLFLDIETNKDKHLTCIGLGIHKNIYVIPWLQYNNTFFYSNNFYHKFIQALVIAMNNNTIIVHNGMFDLFVLAYYYKIPFPKTKIIDTMISWHRVFPELEKSLGHLLSYLTWLPYHKSEGIFNPMSAAQDKQLWNYNANDIIAMMELLPKLKEEISNNKGVEDSANFACSMIRPYLTMMYKGIKVDVEKILGRFKELDFKCEQIDRCLRIVTNKNLNPRSPKQVKQYLYDECGHPCMDYEAPTNEKTLLKLLTLNKQTIPSVRLILASRGVGKTASSLKYNLYRNDRTTDIYDRATCAYNLAGTDTFRLSSRALLKFRTDKGFGTNLQNISKDQRDLYIADESKIFIQCDQAGAEALIVAYLCRPGAYRDLFEANVKCHSYVALHLFANEWSKRYKRKESINELLKLKPKEFKTHPDWFLISDLIKDSDDWPAKERYYFIAKMVTHSSVTKDHEVLTKSGWMFIDKACETNSEILSVDIYNNFNSKFERPTNWTVYNYDKELYSCSARSISCAVTHNHRIPYHNNGKTTVKFAEQLTKKSGRIPITSNYTEGKPAINLDLIRLMVAVQADGHIIDWNRGKIEFRFSKFRKCIRLIKILVRLKIDYSYNRYDKTIRYMFLCPEVLKYFNGIKLFDNWLLKFNVETFKVILDEIKYWDGSTTYNRNRYFTKHKQNADWIQTIAHLSGYKASIDCWPSSNNEYCVTYNNKYMFAQNLGLRKNNKPYNDLVYSPTVSTGFFLIRRKDRISVTGNSNYGIKAPTFQMNVLQKSDGAIALNIKECNVFLGLYHSLFPEILEWHCAIQRELNKTRILRNLFNEPRKFFEQKGDTLWKQGYAFIPQSTVGEITNRAVVALQNEIDNNYWPFNDNNRIGFDLLQNGHDSILAQVNENVTVETIKHFKSKFEVELTSPYDNIKFRMKSEVSIGKNWGPYKEKSNLLGMQSWGNLI